jgi:hypothetical protein
MRYVTRLRKLLTKFENPVCITPVNLIVVCCVVLWTWCLFLSSYKAFFFFFFFFFDSLEFMRKSMQYHIKVLHCKLLLKTFYVRNMQAITLWKALAKINMSCPEGYGWSFLFLYLQCQLCISSIDTKPSWSGKLDVVTLGNWFQTQCYQFYDKLLISKCWKNFTIQIKQI